MLQDLPFCPSCLHPLLVLKSQSSSLLQAFALALTPARCILYYREPTLHPSLCLLPSLVSFLAPLLSDIVINIFAGLFTACLLLIGEAL